MTWMPKARNVVFEPKPPEIPDHIYNEAMTAKRFYNEQWEFWVWTEWRDKCHAEGADIPVNVVEDACIRGLKKAINRVKYVHGDAIGEWYERFLDMGDLFNKVKHPDYIKQLGY